MIFKRKYSVTILDENWGPIKDSLKLFVIPRTDEMIYLDIYQKYYKVLNVVHYLNDKHGIFVIVKVFEQENKA